MVERTFTLQHVRDLSMNESSSERKTPGYTSTNSQVCIQVKGYNTFQKLLFIISLSNDSRRNRASDNSQSLRCLSVAIFSFLRNLIFTLFH